MKYDTLPSTSLTQRCYIIPTRCEEVSFLGTDAEQYSRVTLRPHKWGITSRFSDYTPKDAVYDYFAPTFIKSIDNAILFGTGVDQPLGIANSPAAIEVGATQDISYDLQMMYRQFYGTGVWVTKQPEVLLPYMTNGSLMGFPVVYADVPDIDEYGGLILADFSKYVVVDRFVNISEFEYGINNIAYRMIVRWDGRPIVSAPHNGLSPFVVRGGLGVYDAVKTIVICLYCGQVWEQGQVKCWDGQRGCGNSLLEPKSPNIVCKYCGRIWPVDYARCWDGGDGCGGGLV